MTPKLKIRAIFSIVLVLVMLLSAISAVVSAKNIPSTQVVSFKYHNEAVSFMGENTSLLVNGTSYTQNWAVYKAPNIDSWHMMDLHNEKISRINDSQQNSVVKILKGNKMQVAEVSSFGNDGAIDQAVAINNLESKNITVFASYAIQLPYQGNVRLIGINENSTHLDRGSSIVLSRDTVWGLAAGRLNISWMAEMSIFEGGILTVQGNHYELVLEFGPITISGHGTVTIDPKMTPLYIPDGDHDGDPCYCDNDGPTDTTDYDGDVDPDNDAPPTYAPSISSIKMNQREILLGSSADVTANINPGGLSTSISFRYETGTGTWVDFYNTSSSSSNTQQFTASLHAINLFWWLVDVTASNSKGSVTSNSLNFTVDNMINEAAIYNQTGNKVATVFVSAHFTNAAPTTSIRYSTSVVEASYNHPVTNVTQTLTNVWSQDVSGDSPGSDGLYWGTITVADQNSANSMFLSYKMAVWDIMFTAVNYFLDGLLPNPIEFAQVGGSFNLATTYSQKSWVMSGGYNQYYSGPGYDAEPIFSGDGSPAYLFGLSEVQLTSNGAPGATNYVNYAASVGVIGTVYPSGETLINGTYVSGTFGVPTN